MVYFWCEVNLHPEEWSMDKHMVSKIWVGMSTTNIHLLHFKIQSHLQKWELWILVPQNSFQKTKENKTKQKTKQNKTKQNKTKQNKTKNKTKQKTNKQTNKQTKTPV